MLQTTHVAVGVAIATKIPNPLISVPLALASHFVLDKTPHWNPHTYTETQKLGRPSNNTIALTLVDIGVSLTLGLSFAYLALPNTAHAITIVACSLASVLPDVTKYPFFMFKSLRKGFYKRWVDFERSLQADVSFLPGVTTQLIITAFALWWILF